MIRFNFCSGGAKVRQNYLGGNIMSGNSKYSKIYSRSPRLRRIHRRIEDALLGLAKIVLNTTLCAIVLVIETETYNESQIILQEILTSNSCTTEQIVTVKTLKRSK